MEKSLVEATPIFPKTVQALSKHQEASQNKQSQGSTFGLKPFSNILN
jgi:hypothetical protein